MPDRPACARELRRALDSSGVVVVRTTFGDQLDAIVYEYWPRLLDVDRNRFPSCDEVVADFEAAGFQTRETTSMAQPVTRSLAEYHDRMTTQPQSKFKYVSSEEFADGLRRLRDDAASSPVPTPVMERYDVGLCGRLKCRHVMCRREPGLSG